MSFLEQARAKLADDDRRERERQATRLASDLEGRERLRATLAASRERSGEQAKRDQAEGRKRLAESLGKIAERIDPLGSYAALPVENTWVLFSDLTLLEQGRSAALRIGLTVGSRGDIKRVPLRSLAKRVRSVAFVDPSPAELAKLAP